MVSSKRPIRTADREDRFPEWPASCRWWRWKRRTWLSTLSSRWTWCKRWQLVRFVAGASCSPPLHRLWRRPAEAHRLVVLEAPQVIHWPPLWKDNLLNLKIMILTNNHWMMSRNLTAWSQLVREFRGSRPERQLHVSCERKDRSRRRCLLGRLMKRTRC